MEGDGHGRQIRAVGMLSQRDLDNLGAGLRRMFKMDETPCFVDLLSAIDKADLDFRRDDRTTSE